MSIKEYQKTQIEKLIEEFKNKFEKKIGYKPNVYITKNKETTFFSLDEIEKIINNFIPEHIKKEYKVNSITFFTRKREVCDLRHIFCLIAKNMGYTLMNIGNYLYKRDHTTVINSCKKCINLINTDECFEELYNKITEIINENLNGNELLQYVDEESVDTESTLSTVLL